MLDAVCVSFEHDAAGPCLVIGANIDACKRGAAGKIQDCNFDDKYINN